MSTYSCLKTTPRSWETVLASSAVKTFKFDIVDAAVNGGSIRIANTDGTTTVLEGEGLATSAKLGGTETTRASLTAGTITRLARFAEDDTLLEEITNLALPACGPSKIVSFSRPAGTLSSIAWALEGAERNEMAAALAPIVASKPTTPEATQSGVKGETAPASVPSSSPAASLETLTVTPSKNYQRAEDERATAPVPKGYFKPEHSPYLVFGAALMVGFIAVLVAWKSEESAGVDLEKARFARPTSIPTPSDNALSPARVILGQRLFHETKLSANDKVNCATCHDPDRAFAQPVAFGKGVSGKTLRRHTQTIWNMAWGRAFFWDGRTSTLEEQARFPLEDADEMGQPLETSMAKLLADPGYATAFAAAYPDATVLHPDLILKALAAYQRTLVSPPTRFDRWIAGSQTALSPQEREGFTVFTGKANCVSCHSGWAFTDHGFHDIGLPTANKVADRGRGAVLKLATLDNAFKTPSLRELKWTGPYMHDGSLATLEDVLRHYERGVVERPTLSRDLPKKLDLTPEEREALLAFLGTLSSDGIPKPRRDIEIARERNVTSTRATPSMLKTIGQKDKRFAPENVRINLGEALLIVNNDSRPHNVSIAHPRMGYSSGLQEPGEQVKIPFPEAGLFDIFCGIHPNMRLAVDVRAPAEVK